MPAACLLAVAWAMPGSAAESARGAMLATLKGAATFMVADVTVATNDDGVTPDAARFE